MIKVELNAIDAKGTRSVATRKESAAEPCLITRMRKML